MAEQKTIGQKLYELINPCKAGDPIRPAMWDEVDEDWQSHYERAASAFLSDGAAASAVWDQAVAKCIEAIGSVAWKHEGNDAYSKGMDQGARHQVDACIEALRSLKRSDKTESDNG